jgi:hypothetical protein
MKRKTTTRKDAESQKPKARIGRPPTGKRSNPDYRQVSAWIKDKTYKRVKLRLLMKEEEEGHRDFSVLVQELLEEWLRRG